MKKIPTTYIKCKAITVQLWGFMCLLIDYKIKKIFVQCSFLREKNCLSKSKIGKTLITDSNLL